MSNLVSKLSRVNDSYSPSKSKNRSRVLAKVALKRIKDSEDAESVVEEVVESIGDEVSIKDVLLAASDLLEQAAEPEAIEEIVDSSTVRRIKKRLYDTESTEEILEVVKEELAEATPLEVVTSVVEILDEVGDQLSK